MNHAADDPLPPFTCQKAAQTHHKIPAKITEWSIQARRIDSKVCSSMCRKSMPRNSAATVPVGSSRNAIASL
ncbi:unnamed protein product [Sphagnum jensenii]